MGAKKPTVDSPPWAIKNPLGSIPNRPLKPRTLNDSAHRYVYYTIIP